MVARRILAATLAASGLSQATSDGLPISEDFGPSVEVAKSRAPQIFNAVHDSMRQWGASLHHNGMSFFLATVPEGVIFHHGNDDERSPDEPDWLAYEVEHAEGFARGGRGPGGGPGKGPGGGGPPPLAGDGVFQAPLGYEGDLQESLRQMPRDEPPVESKGGWLHTYRTSRPMRYIYIDGMSGGKTTMGTLDSQDHLLRRTKTEFDFENRKNDVHERRAGGPMDERQRAIEICALCKDWNLDGAVRMEAGFEIIHCDFYDGLEQLQVMQRPASNSRGPGAGSMFGNFEFIRGLSERYHDIGSARTNIDYSSMVSAFFFPINMTNPDPARPDLPRLLNATEAELEGIRGYLNKTIAARLNDPVRPIDWQDVTDLIVGRYADRLKFMAEKTTSVEEIADELKFLLTVYVDYSGKDSDSEQVPAAIDRCTNFYLHGVHPVTESDELIHAAFKVVTSNICTKLFEVRDLVTSDSEPDDSETMTQAVETLTGLMQYLSWARFKRCPPCGVDEVCFIPMWPMGTKADYESPSCVNSSSTRRGDSDAYWGHFGGPGGPGGGKGGRDGRGPRP